MPVACQRASRADVRADSPPTDILRRRERCRALPIFCDPNPISLMAFTRLADAVR